MEHTIISKPSWTVFVVCDQDFEKFLVPQSLSYESIYEFKAADRKIKNVGFGTLSYAKGGIKKLIKKINNKIESIEKDEESGKYYKTSINELKLKLIQLMKLDIYEVSIFSDFQKIDKKAVFSALEFTEIMEHL